ncbi:MULTISPECIES: ABC transporter permease [Turicibacter]|uniref:Peptide ABC transporter permease n=1 Tax=Turicibacter faecis TaxID=2963365 RepID=A0ABM8INM1_9FIRM|nr:MULTISPECIES: ABC transporter permease [unclassified Turicibacter]MCU7204038.1 ABC transporter permease [Turicibacter sp. TA25]MCU7209767.1 ABC transporter permease [Turicibacter sp. 1E2]NCE78703.1 ABC transporter permease [Turicibacter sp. TS3]BEH91524.1 peptide ABC transporter permease [Turicibacter sp. TC023]
MFKYILKRIGYMIITLFLVLTVNFLLLQLIPGSPFDGEKVTEAQKIILEQKYGLDDPIPVQYVRYMKGVVQGDFGISFKLQNQEVSDLVLTRIPYTIKPGALALLIGVVVGILFGAIAAMKRNSWADHTITIISVLGVSIPSFVLAAFLQYFICSKLGWLPLLYQPMDTVRGVSAMDEFKSLILPSISLAVPVIASLMRYMRSELIEVLNTDYILLARAKGLTRSQVIFHHALRNALIPVITVVGPMVVSIMTGSLVIEQFFGVPGLSKLMLNSVTMNDQFLTLGIAFFYAVLYVVVILVIDLLYGVIDPRIRLTGGAK